MKKFFKDCKGAVTVMVTLLLIPAVLVSGTGVDLARIYAARSIIHDANQLTANSALASYQALLQDLYGLFGYMHEDEELGELMNTYIETAIFGDDDTSTGLGTFQLFYGSNLQPVEIKELENQNLENTGVLRRQIEEYVKFRAPVAIADKVISILDSFKKLDKDREVIDKKMEVDKQVEELEKVYKKLYDKIEEVNSIGSLEDSILNEINRVHESISKEFKKMEEVRSTYVAAIDAGDEETAKDCQQHYLGLQKNIRALVSGGKFADSWSDGDYNDDGVWIPGSFSTSVVIDGLESHIEKGKEYIETANDLLDELVNLCKEIQSKKSSLAQKVNELERSLTSGECSEELTSGLMKTQIDGKSIIEKYRSLLSYDVDQMGYAVHERNSQHLYNFNTMLNDMVYGRHNAGTTSVISLENLKELSSVNGFQIDLELINRNRSESNRIRDALSTTIDRGYDLYHFSKGDQFYKFQDSVFSSTKNPEFYAELEKMSGNSSESKKDKVKSSLTDILGTVQDFLQKGFGSNPEGAHYLRIAMESEGEDDSFGVSGDWGEEDVATSQVDAAMDSSFITNMGNLMSNAANKILLTTYCTEMFSQYTTTSDPEVINIAGIPLGIDVNYFFQSEQEYLFHGDAYSAKENLSAVASVIFLIRFVMNYIVSFTIPAVNSFVSRVVSAAAFAGPFAVAIGELARIVIVLGESALDVARLRTGNTVVILKNKDTWLLSLSGITNILGDNIEDAAKGEMEGLIDISDDSGITYADYLCVFLLTVDGDALAERTADLIGWNMTNKIENIGSKATREEREAAMEAATQFDMSSAITDFKITTTVDLRMLFLSMPFSQRGVNGVVPPGKLQLTVEDYRGY